MQLELVLLAIVGLCLAVVIYHHVGYPLLLEFLGKRAGGGRSSKGRGSEEEWPSVAVIVPAHNEADVIAAKIANLTRLEYPAGKLRIILVFDGCTDGTPEIARDALPELPDNVITMEYPENIGKIAVINNVVAGCTEELVALSDASAIVSPDALLRAAAHFRDPDIGVVCATYRLEEAGSEGEHAYWQYQTKIKMLEAALAAPMGAHGAFYAFRRSLWQPLATDTINDDFFIPMAIVLAGYRSVYDADIVATEVELTTHGQEFRRRVRIGAGNMQQLVRMPQLINPKRGYLALLFVSGKGLRALIPLALLLGALSLTLLVALSPDRYQHAMQFMLLAGIGGALAARARSSGSPRFAAWLGYALEGHLASGMGGLIYLTRRRAPGGSGWGDLHRFTDTLPVSVVISKRASDILMGSLLLAVLALAVIPVAIAIKLDSRGPVFYRQLRVGARGSNRTELVELFKFRTMQIDAESRTGAVWAKQNDPRITRIGRLLRKTRLDELPQCINVLRGEMAIVGPRPERPQFVRQLESSIPFYVERTYGLKPGITGLAQVRHGYDGTIEDVQTKVAYDHAYALELLSWSGWLKADLSILWRTIFVVARGQGQ